MPRLKIFGILLAKFTMFSNHSFRIIRSQMRASSFINQARQVTSTALIYMANFRRQRSVCSLYYAWIKNSDKCFLCNNVFKQPFNSTIIFYFEEFLKTYYLFTRNLMLYHLNIGVDRVKNISGSLVQLKHKTPVA